MSVAFIEEPDKEETVPVTVSFTSGEKATFRLPTSKAQQLLTAWFKFTAKSTKRLFFATSTGVLAFDLTHIVKIEVLTSRGEAFLARI
jgi:hypothetical protein